MIAVPDDERERSTQRAAVPKAGEHLDGVLFDALARAAAVALLAAAKIGVDRVALEHEPRGQTGDDRDERGPVRLARRDELERHHAERTAARMTSTGAGTPVHSSNAAAPCATSTSSPSTTRCAGGLGRTCRRSARVRQIDEGLAGGKLRRARRSARRWH